MRVALILALVGLGSHLVVARRATAADAPAADDAAADAKAVLAAAGVRVGLCLHLGCGRPSAAGLTAALAEGSEMPVHGLAFDDADLARARAAVTARGLGGRAMIEKATGKRLPYVPNLAALAVVDDMPALAERGLRRDEILRVLAPGGVLCEKRGGAWTATVKPRPETMDEWTHPHHGPDGSLVSADRALAFPIGLRWIAGTPFGTGGFGSCAPCRAAVFAGGRCFAVNVDSLHSKRKDAYLIARDAFSGFPLWEINCRGSYSRLQLDWRNVWPVVATDRRVYARQGKGLIVADAASGEILATCATKFTPWRLLLLDGTLLAASWEKMTVSRAADGFESDNLRAVWWPDGAGCVQAFNPETGEPRWALPLTVLTMAASDGTAYLLTQEGNPPTKREVVAVALATGEERWRVPHTAFGKEADTCLNFAGPDCAVVSRTKARGKREVFVLSAADGSIRHRLPGTTARALVGDELWCSNGRYSLKTGKKVPGVGVGGTYAGGNVVGGCVPPIVVGGRYVTESRRGAYLELLDSAGRRPRRLSYPAARGACIMGMIPANGMLYTAQNNCACFSAQVGGFLAFGPCEAAPSAERFARPRPVEKGPAFGAVGPAPAADDWPAYRQNAEHSGGTTAALPKTLKVLWKTPCVTPGAGRFADAWDARIGAPQPLTQAIVAAGTVFVVGLDAGEVIALNPATGDILWRSPLGSRIDSPPTYRKGLLLVGCHDGWVYALRAADGALAYRVQVAPEERRIVAYGMVESVWPATGSVLVHDGVAFATAGRSTRTEGGIAVVAFKPDTGETLWTRTLGGGLVYLTDALSIRSGELAFHRLRLDPKTGADLPPAQAFYNQFSLIDGSWSAGFGKRSGRGFMLGRVCMNMMAWNDRLVVWPGAAVARAKADAPKPPPKTRAKHPDRFKREDLAWTMKLKPHIQWSKVNAMALTGTTALFAGSVYTYLDPNRHAGDFLWMKSATDGTTQQAPIRLESPAVYDGLAAAGGRVFLSQQNGVLVCLGG